MKNQSFLYCIIVILSGVLVSCSTTVRIPAKQKMFSWQNNSGLGHSGNDSLLVISMNYSTKAIINLKTDYLVIKPKDSKFKLDTDYTLSIQQTLPAGYRTDEAGNLIFPETKYVDSLKTLTFHYRDWKFGVQALTIPFKFRRALMNRTLFPPTLETGVNLGFAGGIKREWNTYRPTKNFWGNYVSTFSITAGPMIGGSGVDLKALTNAPGLIGDRKAFAITYGGYVMLGYGNISFGYAVGMDRVTGPTHKNWVYNGKLWQGIIIALDVLKF